MATTADISSNPVSDPLVSVRNLWKIFGPRLPNLLESTSLRDLSASELLAETGCTAAVRDLSFDVAAGEVFVIMGLSGSGKSTLVRCLSRLIEPSSGEVLLDGEDILKASADKLRQIRRNKISMVFQHFGLLPHKRVMANVSFGLKLRGVKKQAREARAREMINLVGLAGNEAAFPSQLSGGMQQRVGLARALANDPQILLFDEPFSALDPLIRRDMQSEIARLHKEIGKTMIFITHDLHEALKLGDRIAIMRNGQFEQIGTAAQVVAAPASEYVRRFVQDIRYADVVTVRWIMRPYTNEKTEELVLGPDVSITNAARIALHSTDPIRIVDHGRILGIVNRNDILEAVIGKFGP